MFCVEVLSRAHVQEAARNVSYSMCREGLGGKPHWDDGLVVIAADGRRPCMVESSTVVGGVCKGREGEGGGKKAAFFAVQLIVNHS